MKILLGITGSIAAYRMPNFISQGRKAGHEFRVVVSEHALDFVAAQSLAIMSQHACYRDQDEWGDSDSVLHIELAKWCEICLIAPLTANTLAKLANGLCDNLLTSVTRALGEKPLIVAPAMNTRMWESPFTTEHLDQLSHHYELTVIPPTNKVLADGDEGPGALAEDDTILQALNNF